MQPAVMVSFSPAENVGTLRRSLAAIAPRFEDIEIEELVLYGKVQERLKKKGFRYQEAYDPRNIPEDQV